MLEPYVGNERRMMDGWKDTLLLWQHCLVRTGWILPHIMLAIMRHMKSSIGNCPSSHTSLD
eukprot:3741052-Amphidinium_carterae.1